MQCLEVEKDFMEDLGLQVRRELQEAKQKEKGRRKRDSPQTLHRVIPGDQVVCELVLV